MKHVVSSALLLGLSSLSWPPRPLPSPAFPPSPWPHPSSNCRAPACASVSTARPWPTGAHRPYAARWSRARHCSVCSRFRTERGGTGAATPGSRPLRRCRHRPGDSVDLGALSVVATQDPATAAITEDSGSYTRAMRTSTKLAMSIRETPQSVSVVTRQRMDDQGMRDLNDAVKGRHRPHRATVRAGPGEVRGARLRRRQHHVRRPADEHFHLYPGRHFRRRPGHVRPRRSGARCHRPDAGAGNPAAAISMVRKRPTQDFRASCKAASAPGTAIAARPTFPVR